MTEQTQFLINQAVVAIKAGDMTGGRKLLEGVLELEPDNESAWLWMSAAVVTDDERRHCLEQILRINPDNAQAKRGLEKLSPAPAPKKSAFDSMMADFAAFDSKPASGEQAFSFDIPEGTELPPELANLAGGGARPGGSTPSAPTWAFEPEQRDLAPEFPPADTAAGELDLEALFKSFDAKAESGVAETKAASAGDAFQWNFEQPAEGNKPGLSGEPFAAEESLDRFLGVEQPAENLRGFYQEDARQGKPVPAFTFDAEPEDVDTASEAFVSPPLPDTDFSFDVDKITGAQTQDVASQGVETHPEQSSGNVASLRNAPPARIAEGLLKLWTNPGGKNNRVAILRDEYLILANPDALFVERIREEVGRGEVKKKSLGRTAKAIELKSVQRVEALPEGSSLDIIYHGKQKATAEFDSTAARDEALEALSTQLGAGFQKVEESAGRGKLVLGPLIVMALGVLGALLLAFVSTQMFGLPSSLTDFSLPMLLLLVIAGAGLLTFLGGLLWLLARLRRPLRKIALVPAPVAATDELGERLGA